jgi:hypothetical protein
MMMENVQYGLVNPSSTGGYDVEFYSTTPTSSSSSRAWKELSGGLNNNNNHLMSTSSTSEGFDSSFSINMSTDSSELFIDELIELADNSGASNSQQIQPPLTPKPLVQKQPQPQPQVQHPVYHSRLHEALTQPRLPTQPVKCHRCGNELTSRCLMQTCVDDARCRQCGRDLTAKCILQVCTVQPNLPNLGTTADHDLAPVRPVSRRRHHYSSPSN